MISGQLTHTYTHTNVPQYFQMLVCVSSCVYSILTYDSKVSPCLNQNQNGDGMQTCTHTNKNVQLK